MRTCRLCAGRAIPRKARSMDKDPRAYITLANEAPKHRKIRHLSDTAFRVWIELLTDCNANLTDGEFTAVELYARGKKAGQEILDAGLAQKHDRGFILHDYLKHQTAREEVSGLSKMRSEAAKLGNHIRHHEEKGVKKKGCKFCFPSE